MTERTHDAIERHAPRSAAGRVFGAALLSLLGVPGAIYSMWGFAAGDSFIAAPLLVVSLSLCYLGVAFARSVIRQAEGTNGPRSDIGEDGIDAADPLSILRTRYADGEIDDAEFERRLERLLETEDAGELTGRSREPAVARDR